MTASRILPFILVLAVVITIAAPFVVAMPLLNQTPALLTFAHTAAAAAPWLALAVAAILAIWAFRARTWLLWILLGVSLVCLWLVHVNLFEWIFAPARDTVVTDIRQFRDIRDTDMVIGVTLGAETRAYPVRYLAYHHMLNDQLGSTALLPTY